MQPIKLQGLAVPPWKDLNLFKNILSAQKASRISKINFCLSGPLSIAIPGEIFGYFEAKEKYGNKNISMLSLMQPTIDMCRNGIEVSWSAVKALKGSEELIFKDPGMRFETINIL